MAGTDFRVEPALPSDMDDLISIYIPNFSYHYFNSLMFPIDKITEPVLRRYLARRWGKFFSWPEQHFFKLVEVSTGKTVAWARWGFPAVVSDEEKAQRKAIEDAQSAELLAKGEVQAGGKYPIGANAEMADFYFGNFETYREQFLDRANDYTLDFLAVHPDYHRRGLGQILLRHVLDQVDAENRRCYLEATPSGHGLYSKMGFRDLMSLPADVVRWGVPGGKPYGDTIMIRDARGVKAEV